MEERARLNSSVAPTDVLVGIVDALAARGVPPREYDLYGSIDVEAVARLVGSATGDVTVRFTVEGVEFLVTKAGVEPLDSYLS